MFKLTFTHKFQITLFLGISVILFGVFAYVMGDLPFINQNTTTFHVDFGFSGGLLKGSPVRLAGVSVGKVSSITLHPGRRPPVTVSVSISAEAQKLVREDSQFVINMVGVMGESYVEITPGHPDEIAQNPKSHIRGIDPPRLDQIMAESYKTFQAANAFMSELRPELKNILSALRPLVQQVDETVSAYSGKDKQFFLKHLISLVTQMDTLLKKVNTMDAKTWTHVKSLVQKTSELARNATSENAKVALFRIRKMIERLYKVDEKALRKFLQKEGIKARMF